MEKSFVLNGNKLIAKFMGYNSYNVGKGDFYKLDLLETIISSEFELEDQGYILPQQLGYHKSWDWLIPVVQKIRSIEKEFVKLGKNINPNFIWVLETRVEIPIEVLYVKIIKFIKWYNENKE